MWSKGRTKETCMIRNRVLKVKGHDTAKCGDFKMNCDAQKSAVTAEMFVLLSGHGSSKSLHTKSLTRSEYLACHGE